MSSVSQSSYSKLIGELVNQTKREVEDSWSWVRLRTTIQVPTVADTLRYTLIGAGNRYKLLSAFNDTADLEMWQIPSKTMTQYYTGGAIVSGSPINFDFNGFNGDDPNVDVWPLPSSVENLNFDLVVPQGDLSADADILTISEYPVILGAYAKAAAERGEDGGFMFVEAESNYQKALSDAIALDAYSTPYETIWETV